VELPGTPVWLQADPDRVVQILVNLLTNACRHSDRGGTIAIGAAVGATEVTLYVRDAGHGIRREDLARVFDRFVQVGETRHGGLGIGLALVRALTELQGGAVEARSAGLGLGSEFRVRLPLGTPAAAAAEPKVSAPAITPHRILVVDDNRDAADMLATVLGAHGHVVRVAYDGPQALELATLFRPEVGLLDIGMDGMNGYDLAIRLRREPLLAGLFLVAITGMGQEEDRQRALASGFDAHLTKPADPEALQVLLASRVSSRLSRRSGVPSFSHSS
jgi:two-component system CheB/CheR fusion protein